jgi:hypothetical protein
VERQLRPGDTFMVIAGPSCNGGFTWWRVETDNSERGWAAEGDWEVYYLLPAWEGAVYFTSPYVWYWLEWAAGYQFAQVLFAI